MQQIQYQKKKIIIFFLVLWLLIILFILVNFSHRMQTGEQHAAGTGMPRVVGTQIIDGNNNVIQMRGAMVESSLAYYNQYTTGQNPLTVLNSKTFNAMQSWGMNVVRIDISEWIYATNSTQFMNQLDTAVTQANQVGLYVIIDFHDNKQSGSPYGDQMLHPESLTWWKTIATHYVNNPMVMYDPENEPKYPDWTTWAHGSTSTNTVGFLDVIAAIRSTGSQQIIVVEPGNAGVGPTKGWTGFNVTMSDTNIVYSYHAYHGIITGNQQTWDAEWGPILNNHPIYYGEWAVKPNGLRGSSECAGLTSSNADQITNTFLAYMQSRGASWTAWQFYPPYLITNSTTFNPSNFQTGAPWACPDPTTGGNPPTAVNDGMGEDVKNFLLTQGPRPSFSLSPSPTLTSMVSYSPTPTTKITLTPIPTINPNSTVLSLSIGLHDIGIGDNVNISGTGVISQQNPMPQHVTRNVVATLSDTTGNNPKQITGQITFPGWNISNSNGPILWTGILDVSAIPAGDYQVSIKTDGFLQQRIPQIIHIVKKQTILLPTVVLVNGDVNNDNQIDILDYNMLISCFGVKVNQPSCQVAK